MKKVLGYFYAFRRESIAEAMKALSIDISNFWVETNKKDLEKSVKEMRSYYCYKGKPRKFRIVIEEIE